MKFSLKIEQLSEYVCRQVNTLIPDGLDIHKSIIIDCMPDTLDRLSNCFKHIALKSYRDKKGEEYFNHNNGNHYSMFLYYLTNTVWKKTGDEQVASKLFMLNKIINCVDIFYEVELPDIFVLIHPVGTILGRAKYSDYFVVYQGCTVGSREVEEYPIIGENVMMCSHSSILGKCKLSNNIVIGAHTFLLDTNVEENKVVLGQYPSNRIINTTKRKTDDVFIK